MTEHEQALAHWQQQQERERAALARQLHDQLGGALAALGLQLHRDGVAATSAQHALLAQAQDCQRQVAAQLRPPLLDHLGLSAALAALFEQQCAAQGLQLQLQLPVTADRTLPAPLAIALYRAAEVALRNVLQHAAAQVIGVNLHYTPQRYAINITDDGVGCEPALAFAAARSLCAVRGWLQAEGGSLSLQSNPTTGMTFSAAADF